MFITVFTTAHYLSLPSPRSFCFPQQKVQSVPTFSYLIPCRPTPTTLHLQFACFMATTLSDTDPYSPVTFHVPNISPFPVAYVVHNDVHKPGALSNISQHVTLFTVSSVTHPAPKLENHPLSAVRYC